MGKKKKKRYRQGKNLSIDDYWPSKATSIEESPPKKVSNQTQDPSSSNIPNSDQVNIKIITIMRQYVIGEKNIKKAYGLWSAMCSLHPICKTIANPYQWIYAHEELVKKWEHTKDQVKNTSETSDILSLVRDEHSALCQYMNYMYKYFVD